MSRYFFIFILFITFSNNLLAQSEKLIFSHEHGFYENAFNLIVSVEKQNAVIRYTLDGSNPFTSQTAYSSASPLSIRVDPASSLKKDISPAFILTVCAIHSDTLISKIKTQSYFFLNLLKQLSPHNSVPGDKWLRRGESNQEINYGLDSKVYNDLDFLPFWDEAFSSIPTLSLVTDLDNLFDPNTGIYVNARQHGREWERQGSIELLNPDGSEGFSENCGIRVRGGYSRNERNPKHAFRLFFRDEYGAKKLKYPLFEDEGVEEFDKIDLRTAQNYSWSYDNSDQNTFLREVFSRDTQGAMGQPYTKSRYYHLYINGVYWGLFQTQERSEASFAQSYFGGEREDYDVVKVNGDYSYTIEATDGNLDLWKKLWDFAYKGFTNDEDYFRVQGLNTDGTENPAYPKLLDVDNLIDYMLITFFVGDFDGPISNFLNNEKPNNFYGVINRNNPDGFKFFRHDAEHSMFDNGWGRDRTGPFNAGWEYRYSNPQFIHQRLSTNSHYRLRFADRVNKHFFNDGVFVLDNCVNRIKKRKAQIETAIIAESARWGDSKRSNPYTKFDWQRAVDGIINGFLPFRNNTVLQQLINKNLFQSDVAPQFNQYGGKVAKGFNLNITAPGEIYYTLDGTDPYSPTSAENGFEKPLIINATKKTVFVPKSDIGNNWRSDKSFNDSGWGICEGEPGGIGYERGSGYEGYISYSTLDQMSEEGQNPNNSCYIRIKFNLTKAEIDSANYLDFSIFADDGFVIYLNGSQVASQNAPSDLNWSSSATNLLDDGTTLYFDLSSQLALLNEGENLLAIHGLNVNVQSSDFIILPTLTIGQRVNGGVISDTAIKYDTPISINSFTHIKARSISGGLWSPLTEAKFALDQPIENLRITELHYHPMEQDTIGGKNYEFLELKNVGNEPIDLLSMKFINGIDLELGNFVLLPSEFYIVASDSSFFHQRYGFYPDDQFFGNLENSGERVTFVDAIGDTILNFRYNDKLPWPESADGDGPSLVSYSLKGNGDPDNASYWIASGNIHGSPGEDDIVSNIEETISSPLKYSLYNNYPNPFNPETRISFTLPNQTEVKLVVYNTLGEEVTTLINSKLNSGKHSVLFNAYNLASGVYIYKLKSEFGNLFGKMLLLK